MYSVDIAHGRQAFDDILMLCPFRSSRIKSVKWRGTLLFPASNMKTHQPIFTLNLKRFFDFVTKNDYCYCYESKEKNQ